MIDLLLRGGTVIDGTGAPAFVADVGVSRGRINCIGPTDEPAGRVVDVTGLIVAPGFVDIHTHYDAQLSWDPTASPSPLHGVTTVIGGNCGFGLAPAGAEHADYLMRLMAQVEGMPLEALEAGLAWDWRDFGDWVGRFEPGLGVNAGFLAGHSAIRRVAMGERAVGEAATGPDLDAMEKLLDQALRQGALGFSTSQAPTHRDGNGDPVPSRFAERDELLRLAEVAGRYRGTSLEIILPGCLHGFSAEEVALLTDYSLAGGRPANWNVLGVSSLNPTGHLSQLEASTRAAEEGARVLALTLPYSMSVRLSFRSGSPFTGLPGWEEIFSLSPVDRIRALRDADLRRRLAQGAASPDAGVLRYLAQWASLELVETFAPEHAALQGRRVGDVAAERDQDPFDVLVDIVVADELRTTFRPPIPSPSAQDWRLRAESWLDPRTVVGGSDAGAHLDMMCGAVYSSSLLESVRQHDTVTWEQAVEQLTSVPADLYSLDGRGRIAEGAVADLVVFDPARVAPGPEHTVTDLPGGAGRLYAGSTGFEHVYVGGTEVVIASALTGATPGQVLRSGPSTGRGGGRAAAPR